MTQIGRLKAAAPDSLGQLRGEIQTLDHRLPLRLEGDEALCDSRTPSHRIYARNRAGAEIEVGSAWLKTAKHGPRTGERFLTLSIDYPGLAAALNVAAFLDRQSGDWVILWRRRGVQAAAALNA